jgi:hypothetical protein
MMAEITLHRLLPSWVESDPLRGRAIDALGLQATADRIADELLPGLSVLTTRARYYAMLAWARRACGTRTDETHIHRLEVALAVREAKLHPKEPASADGANDRCRFVGSRNLPRAPQQEPFKKPPKDPRSAFRTPVWRGYRASMQRLGLLDDDYALTDDGKALAKLFAAACHPPDQSGDTMLPASACLSKMSLRESRLLEARLGVRQKGKPPSDDRSDQARRGAAERELRQLFAGELHLSSVLKRYEATDRDPSFTVSALREAAVWERLSVGLNATFLLWLDRIRTPAATKKLLADARRKRAVTPRAFAAIPIGDDAAVEAIQSVRRALALRDRLDKRGGLSHCDPSAFELGEALVGTINLDEVLTRLEARHVKAKGDDAWIRSVGRRREMARDADDKWEPPKTATLHGYRLDAFGQILADLRHARW